MPSNQHSSQPFESLHDSNGCGGVGEGDRAIRILLVDDHEVILEGLSVLIGRQVGMTVVGQCRTGEEALRLIRQTNPDVVVLDVRLPDMSGLDVLRERPDGRAVVVLFTASATSDEMLQALRLGVRGVVLKDMPCRLLIECIRKVAAGGDWIEKKSIGSVLARLMAGADAQRGEIRRLTHREVEVVQLICRGMPNKGIAEELHLSVSTIKMHLHNIYEKVDVRSRTELIVWAREQGCCP